MTLSPTMKLSLFSPAKLNLFLHITEKREDGYHNLQTLFQLLDYGDRIEFSTNTTGKIELSPSIPGLPHEQNLIYRAAQMLRQHSGCSFGVNIRLEKQLPMGGGLGGGSSNAATTLLGLNQLWQLNLPQKVLMNLGVQLGADVPVFLLGQTAWAEGVGEHLTPVEMPNHWYLVLMPNVHVSTAKVFAHQGLTRNSHPIKIRAFLEQGGKNDCQSVVEALYPEVKKACQWLAQFAEARLTGTGACLFAQFESKADAQSVYEQIPAPWTGFIAKGVNHSLLLTELSS